MEIYTIGFTQTTAERFFERLADAWLHLLAPREILRFKRLHECRGAVVAGVRAD
jgi:hypothetical protein